MTEKEITIKKLHTFKSYVSKGWGGTITFFEIDINEFREQICNCAQELSEAIEQDASQRQLKQIMIPYIQYISDLRIVETEEREYACGIYYELSQLVSVDIAFRLNRVLYDWFLALITSNIFRKKKKKFEDIATLIKVIDAECVSCSSNMQTYIYDDGTGENDMVVTQNAIVACKVCGEFNLVFITEDGYIAHSYDYYMVEQLPDHYTMEEAETRLKQVKVWR